MSKKPQLRVLISVTNKEGLEKFLPLRDAFDLTVISSTGTLKHLVSLGFDVVPVEQITGFPEMMDGRLKTIDPKIAGGILADRDKPEHIQSCDEEGIELIDIVVCNLYDFGGNPSVEKIDIGGPSLLRAAAKNWKHCLPVPSPQYYDVVVEQLLECGSPTVQVRHMLARETFMLTARYDTSIASWFVSEHSRRFSM